MAPPNVSSVIPSRAEVVAIDRQGHLKPGWPYRLPFDANAGSIGAVTVAPDGRLIVHQFSPYGLLALDPAGRLSR